MSIIGYRGETQNQNRVDVKVDLSDREALQAAGLIQELAVTALDQGMEKCGRGEACCLNIDISETNTTGGMPSTTFEIECTREDCTSIGVTRAEVEVIGTTKEVAGH